MGNQKFITENENETKEISRKLSSRLLPGDIVGLDGELGSGKTIFVQGLAQGLEVLEKCNVSSPTYTFIHEYPCKNLMLYHVDFYRLKSSEEAESLGIDEYLKGDGICAIEWFKKSLHCLPSDFLEIKFSALSETKRYIEMISHGPRSQKIISLFF